MAASSPSISPAANASEDAAPLDLFLPLRSAGSLDNPYPVYSLIRTVRPVLQVPIEGYDGPGVWMLTRYRDVHDVLRDPRFSADRAAAPLVRDNLDRMPEFLRQSTQGLRTMLVMDPPDHTRVRKLVNKAFTRGRVNALRGHIEDITNDLADAIEKRERFDLIHDLAQPLPAVVIAELLGVPAEDHRQFREWSSALIQAFGARTAAERDKSTAAAHSLFGYLRGIIAERRAKPRDDLISAMLQAQEDHDALTDDELLATSNLLLIAGHETTTNLIGNGMLALLRDREQWNRLCADRSLLSTAVDELLRFDGPVQATVRVALEDIEIDEHVIPAGAMVIVSIGAANHDPETFDEPDQLDLGRDPNPHLGFGFATHYCLGAPLARLEAEVALDVLSTRFPNVTLVDDNPEYRQNPILRGLTRLELTRG